MLSLLLLPILLTATPTVELHTLDGRSLRGELLRLDGDQAVLKTASGERIVAAGDLQDIAVVKKEPKTETEESGIALELIDGTTLFTQEYTADAERAALTFADETSQNIPTKAIRFVRLQPLDDDLRPQWTRLVKKHAASDLLVTRKESALDDHQGVIEEIAAETIRFRIDEDNLSVKRAKVFALFYRHPTSEPLPKAIASFSLDDGSQWTVQSVQFREGHLLAKTVFGIELDRPLEAFSFLDFSLGKVVYLSDLKPDSAIWTPYLGGEKNAALREIYYAPKNDKNFDGEPLRIDDASFRKGICIHSRTEMVYRLPGTFRRLKAMAGIDDSVRPQGSVRLTIEGNDRTLFDEKITGHDAPHPIDIDLDGVKKIKILVDFGEGLDVGDVVDLGNARIIQ